MSILLLTIILFIAFTIGLNLGLHGVIVVTHPTSHEKKPEIASNDKVDQHTKIDTDHGTDPKPVVKLETKSNPQEAGASAKSQAVDPFKGVQEKIDSVEKRVLNEYTFPTPVKSSFQDTPIVLLTCCRPQLLQETLKSLFEVRGVDKSKVLIAQDGTMAEVKSVAETMGVKVIQNPNTRLRGDGGSRIAQHYRYSLTSAFDFFNKANALVVIEDDLLFSPDFYEYLISAGSILAEDPTTFIVSAWSDNGFAGRVRDPYALRRTDFFPGLGWLLTRKLYKTELESRWPSEHWDHWLRSPEIHQHREIIYPQVPRTFHNGVKGTFMDVSTHNKYFKDIAYNQDPAVTWPSSSSSVPALHQKASYEFYESRIIELIHSCRHLQSIQELLSLTNEIICIWVSAPVYDQQNPPFQKISNFFGLWHEHKRGNHKGLHEFYFYSNYILLLNVDSTASSALPNNYQGKKRYLNYEQLKPKDVPIISRDDFHQNYLAEIKSKQALELSFKIDKRNIFTAMKVDQSCDEVRE